jgi:hypothetical protein
MFRHSKLLALNGLFSYRGGEPIKPTKETAWI